jgi:hypothetical protein
MFAEWMPFDRLRECETPIARAHPSRALRDRPAESTLNLASAVEAGPTLRAERVASVGGRAFHKCPVDVGIEPLSEGG